MDCAVLDLETTDLSAVGSGWILMASIRPLHGETITLRYDEMRCPLGRETKLVKAIIDEMSKYDMWIGHNIQYFDFPYLKSRAMRLGVPFNCEPLVYDTMMAFRRVGYLTTRNFKGHPRANLDHIVDFLGYPQQKTKIYPREHWLTVWGKPRERKDAMLHLAEHCEADVEMTEQVYWHLLKRDPVWGLRRQK
jgi:uncharacterized protein YprB with RNaseH-like and TPR domain